MTPIRTSEILNSNSFLTEASYDVLEAHISIRADFVRQLKTTIKSGPASGSRLVRRAHQGIFNDTLALELYNLRFMCGVVYSRFGADPAYLPRIIDAFASFLRESPELDIEWFQYELTGEAYLLLVDALLR